MKQRQFGALERFDLANWNIKFGDDDGAAVKQLIIYIDLDASIPVLLRVRSRYPSPFAFDK
jgi:hypothetical protein